MDVVNAFIAYLATHNLKELTQFKGALCGKCFSKLDLVKYQNGVHRGIKTFQCIKRCKCFVTKQNLKKHTDGHTDIDVYKIIGGNEEKKNP